MRDPWRSFAPVVLAPIRSALACPCGPGSLAVAAALLLLVTLASTAVALPSTEATEPQGGTIVVTSTADSGPGTLRQALDTAASGDTITFDPAAFPPTSPATVTLTSGLPQISQGNLTIDASHAGVILDGSSIPTDTWTLGIDITSNGNTIRGLQIVGFPGPGIGLHAGSQDNTIGGDRAAGTAPLGQGNLISRNGNVGISLGDTSFNTIRGNYVGTGPGGTEAWGNFFNGIYLAGASHNQIIDNLISDNGADAVGLQGNQTRDNVISGNYIGTDASGGNPLGNHGLGISLLQGPTNNTLGPGNVIAYNTSGGVEVSGDYALGNTITRNSIHDNGGYGIAVWWGTLFVPPVLFEYDLPAGTVRGATCPDCTVEIFSDSEDEGAHFEGKITADSSGVFSLSKGAPLLGPHLTATATGVDGSTSDFSLPTSGTAGSMALQQGSQLPATSFQTRHSSKLLDNRMSGPFVGRENPGTLDSWLYAYGLKRAQVAINHQEPEWVIWDRLEFAIPPEWDAVFTRMAENGLTMTYKLTFWDKATWPGGVGAPCARFKTEGEIQRYLEFVLYMVHNLKDRVEYYELWNEPDIAGYCPKWIEAEDYLNLVRRTVPVIRAEYPEAKIVIGGISLLRAQPAQDYLFALLESDIMPLVDVVSWHPFYSESPEFPAVRDYWYAYPSLVQEIKEVAGASGFKGEYQVDELTWWTTGNAPPHQPWAYSPTVAAKYWSRGALMHLGMDIAVNGYKGAGSTIYNLSTAMAGAEPMPLPMHIQTTVTDTMSYTFSLPGREHLIALWSDRIAADYDPGVTATLTLPGFAGHRVTGIDVLHGFQQPLVSYEEDGNLVVEDLLVKDYPILLRVAYAKEVYLPLVLRE